ncbi:MAG: PepSY-like domain-containing protein [Bacteroidales bacterium]
MRKLLIKSTKLTLIALSMALLFTSFTANADDDKRINFNQLPKTAQLFITRHFSANDIVTAKLDKEITGTIYEVKLKNGTEIDFKKIGTPIKIDCGNNKVPDSIVGKDILAIIKNLYPATFVKKIKYLKTGTEIELSNGNDMIFGKSLKVKTND